MTVSLSIEVPGLDTIVPVIDEGTLIVVEGGADLAKSFFVRRLCRTALHVPRPVTFVTSRDERELRDRLVQEDGGQPLDGAEVRVVERDAVQSLVEYVAKEGILAVDSFSFLTLDLSPTELARMLRDLRKACRDQRTITILTTDQGMFEDRSEAVLTHLAEGYIEFHAQEGPEGILRFLRIPKWVDGRFVDRNIYYSFDGKRIAIDLRSRVL
jgi:KaiC/GvpD/RAD55 family RecA-like ATPase